MDVFSQPGCVVGPVIFVTIVTRSRGSVRGIKTFRIVVREKIPPRHVFAVQTCNESDFLDVV